MQTKRNGFVDSLKGILIIFVILQHYDWKYGEGNSIVFRYCISFAVPMFIFLSGYVSSLSNKAKGIESLEKMYSFDYMIKKTLRIVIPFTIAFVCGWGIFRALGIFKVNIVEYGLLAAFFGWLRGGFGMGSYYFPVYMQFIFLFPLIYLAISKKGKNGLIACFVLNGLFEVLKSAFGMPDYEYRYMFLRYLYVAAAGCYLALHGNSSKKWLEALQLLLGGFFVFLFTKSGYTPKIITYWEGTCFLTCMLIIPVMNVLVSKVKVTIPLLNLFGKASFNIFLVQMIFFSTYKDMLESAVNNYALNVIATVIVCVVVGTLFYLLEVRFTSFAISKLVKERKAD